MKVVIVKHNASDSKNYLFSTAIDLKNGDNVLVNTAKGEQAGVCVCESFEVSDTVLSALQHTFGGRELKQVVGLIYIERFD